MSLPSYTVYANHPRLFFRDTDKSSLQTRIANASGWKSTWDNVIIPAANSYKGQSDAAIATVYTCHCRMMVLALAGYLTESGVPAGGYKEKAISAAAYLAGLADDVAPTNKRNRALALALVFDLLYDDLTSGQRSTLAAEMVQQADRMTAVAGEYMDGHSANDQMCQLALAITGYGTGSYDWSSRITEALMYLYGTTSKGGSLATYEHFCSNGGDLKGGWYVYLGWWGAFWALTFMTNGTTYDAWTPADAWAKKVWEWVIWTGNTGGAYFDKEAQGDTAHVSNPIFQLEQRWAWSTLAHRYPTPDSTEGGKHVRWLYDEWDAKDSAYADNLIFDIILMDKASVAAVAPENAATAPARARLFQPPGIFYFRQSGRDSGKDPWDYDESVVYRISGRQHYDLGHRHLDSGSVQATFKGDRLLLAPAGVYDAYGSTHHLGAYQRTWLQSLAPLIVDPGEVYQFWSATQANDGGQHWRKYGQDSDPGHVWNMLNDEGGLAWLRSELTRPDYDAGTHQFLVADLRRAYVKQWDGAYRAAPLRSKFLIIEPTAANGLTYAALLYFCRITKADQTQQTIIPLHSAKAWTTTAYGAYTTGYRNVGKLWVDIRSIAAYTVTNATPGTPVDSNGYGPDQFKIPGGSTNYKPSVAPNSREAPDLKVHSLYVSKTTQVTTEDYVILLMPTGYSDSEPAASRSWITDAAQPDWYGITIGSTTYLIHRAQDIVSIGTPDSTPPAEVTGLALAARDGGLLATWTDPADSDLNKLKVYHRTSAT